MIKKIFVLDAIAGVVILLELILLSLGLKKMGAVIYIVVDIIGAVFIVFFANFIAHKIFEGTLKTSIVNAIIVVLLYLLISFAYGKTSMGLHTEKTLDQMTTSEQITHMEGEDGIEMSFSDGNAFGQILNYGFYFIVSFAGGQAGTKLKKRREKAS